MDQGIQPILVSGDVPAAGVPFPPQLGSTGRRQLLGGEQRLGTSGIPDLGEPHQRPGPVDHFDVAA